MPTRSILVERAIAEAEGRILTQTEGLAWVIEHISDDPNAYFEWLSTWARAGHDSAARDMLYGFCYFYERSEPVPKAILHFLWLAFNRHLSSDPLPLEKALGLVAPAHRKKGTGGADGMRAVAYLYLLITRDGKKKQEALEAAAARFHISKRHLERFDKAYGAISDMPPADLERLAQPNTPAPSDKK